VESKSGIAAATLSTEETETVTAPVVIAVDVEDEE
jgi:hypothetical protein